MKMFRMFPGEHGPVRAAALAVLTGAALFLFQGTAYAHYPNLLSATVTCSNGGPVITYEAYSWEWYSNQPMAENPAIQILFNGAPVDEQPFLNSTTPPDYFTGSKPAPLGAATVIVQAYAAAPWGDGVQGGQFSLPITLTMPTDCSMGVGRFTGGGKLISLDGVAVTMGFEVDCDLHEPSNNLEINWAGNQFHMMDFTSAVCTLEGKPNPPTAPVNKIVGTGSGRYDGLDGYTVVFTLKDNGEPGSKDVASFLIYETANPSHIILDTGSQFITGGNIQAHVDQK